MTVAVHIVKTNPINEVQMKEFLFRSLNTGNNVFECWNLKLPLGLGPKVIGFEKEIESKL